MSVWTASSLNSSMASTPSLGRSDGSAADLESNPATPSEMSPFINAQMYSIPPVDVMSLPGRADTPQLALHAALPDILHPDTAANVPIKHVCCIGAGYVGGPTAAVIALHNPNVRVTVVDRDETRIEAWKGRHLPIHEPGLADVVRLARDGTSECRRDHAGQAWASAVNGPLHLSTGCEEQARKSNLFFTTACTQTIADADMILVSVNTPTKKRGVGAGRATDMTAVEGAVRDVAMHARPGTIIVEKSTVPCKTGQLIKDIMEAHRPGIVFPVLSNPEFLSEGTAVRDLMQPDRVIIGCESTISGHRAAAALANLYAAWVPRSKVAPINIWSSELCKLAANAMLAQRISSINSISAICERTGADVSEIAKSLGMDPRIGPQFLKAGLGFGGSCFRKDIASLTYLSESLGLPEVAAYWQQVLTMNNFQRDRFARHVISSLNNSLRGKKITILGYAFKKNTGDARESPARDVIRTLLEESPRSIAIFDPLCSEGEIKRELSVLEDESGAVKPEGPVEIISNPYEASSDSNAVLVLTDWDMFKNSKFDAPAKPIAEPHNLDGATPTTILQLQHRSDRTQAPIPKPDPLHAKTSSILSDLTSRLLPEPPCPANCLDCKSTIAHGSATARDILTPLDWTAISKSVREPRWVFDGRGILDARAMVGMGFRLETLGRASMY